MQLHNSTQGTDISLERLIADPNRQVEARHRLAAELVQTPSTLVYLKWSKLLPVTAPRRVAILSSFTIETIAPFLSVEAYLSGWRPDAAYLQYSQWQAALLNPAEMLSGADIAILLIDDKAIGEQLGATPIEAAATIKDILTGFRSRSAVPLLIGLVPARPIAIPYGLGLERHQTALANVQTVNAAITAFCAEDTNSHLLDFPGILATAGPAWHDAAAFAAKMSYVSHKALPALGEALARSVAALLVPRRKVLVTDLDNTLWGGVVGEDGVDGILTGAKNGRAYTEYQKFLRQLRASGILLAIASKNNEADVREVFSRRAADLSVSWDDFTATLIGWGDKASGLRQIATELGLGLDSLVFVDDSPVECEQIRQALPMVTIVQAPAGCSNLSEMILATRAFDTARISQEDLARAEQYKIEQRRKLIATESTDLSSFLASLQLSVAIRPLSAANLDRVTQLLMKTNQFHLSLERPSAAALLARQQAGSKIYAVSLKDRFGDYGIVAVTEFESASQLMQIRNMAISCRALGRAVEETIIAHAADQAREAGLNRIEAEFVQGPRNQLVPEAFTKLGFMATPADDGKTIFHMAVTPQNPAWPSAVHLNSADEGIDESQ